MLASLTNSARDDILFYFDNLFANDFFIDIYIVKKYAPLSLLTNSLPYNDLFDAIHFCIKQGNSCVINLYGSSSKEVFVPRTIS